MLDFVLLVLFLIYVFPIVALGLRKQPGASVSAGVMADNVVEIKTVQEWDAMLEDAEQKHKVVRLPMSPYSLLLTRSLHG